MIDETTVEVELAPGGDFNSDLVLNVPLSIGRTADDEAAVDGVTGFRLRNGNLVIVIERTPAGIGSVSGKSACVLKLTFPDLVPFCDQVNPCLINDETCGFRFDDEQNVICDCISGAPSK